MADLPFDAQERLKLCVLFDELGPSVPTGLERWTAHDLAAHLVGLRSEVEDRRACR